MGKKEYEVKSKAYMRYVLHYLRENRQILEDKGFGSIDFIKERGSNFKPFIEGNYRNDSVPTIQKNFYKAFNLITGPETNTLFAIHKVFNIPIDFEKFEFELKNKNEKYTRFLEEPSSDEIKQSEKTDVLITENSKNNSHEREKEIYERKEFKQKKWKKITLISFLSLLILFIFCWLIFHAPTNESIRPNKVENSAIVPFDTSKGSFNILILPFNPIGNFKFEENDMGLALLRRFNDMKTEDSLNLQVKFVIDSVTSHESADSIGKLYGADIVLWGDLYEKYKGDSTQACLKYVLVKLPESKIKYGSSGIESFASMAEITRGTLQRDIDYIIYFLFGVEEILNDNYQIALGHFEHINTEMRDEVILCLIADCHLFLKSFKKAEEYYLKTLKISPDYGKAHNNLAFLLKEIGDYEGAKQHYMKAINGKSNRELAHYNLAELLKENFKDYEGARKNYLKAIEINPDFERAYNNLGVLLQEEFEGYVEARQYYLQAIEIEPNYAMAHYNLAGLLLILHDEENSKKHYLKATELDTSLIDEGTDESWDIRR